MPPTLHDDGSAAKSSRSDRSLLHLFRHGNSEAAEALYRRYADRLCRLVAASRSDALSARFDAEDVVQSAFRHFFEDAGRGCYDVPQGQTLWSLLAVLALNRLRDVGSFHRAARRDIRRTCGVEAEALGLIAPSVESHFRLVIADELEKLPPEMREVCELRMAGHEMTEIAERTGRSLRTVERLLQGCRQKLSRSV